MRVLFIGDIFGRPGRDAVRRWLPDYRNAQGIDFVIANVENAAGGKGITAKTQEELDDTGIDVMTGGNHTFAHREASQIVEQDDRVLRPANLPPGTPGRGLGFYESTSGHRVAVLNLIGRAFMKPADCPFRLGKRLLEEALEQTPIVFVDFHAEATSEKVAMAAYFDGLATAVIGTHTHVPTADARVSKAGTAAITDVGMSGPYDSVIGVKTPIILDQLIVGMPLRHEAAKGDVRVCGLLVDLNPETGRARSATGVREPEFSNGA